MQSTTQASARMIQSTAATRRLRGLAWAFGVLAIQMLLPTACGGEGKDGGEGGEGEEGGEGGQAGGDATDEAGGTSAGGDSGGNESGSGGRASGGASSGGAANGTGGMGQPSCDDDEEYDALLEACIVPIPCDPTASPFGGGDGSQQDPYLVCSAEQLAAVAGALEAQFVLAASLDLSDVDDFVPIGDITTPFVGTFDGAGRVLVGLQMNLPEVQGVGLFGGLGADGQPATVRNLQLRDFQIEGSYEVGVLAGRVSDRYTLIDTVEVDGGRVTADIDVGGLAGGSAGTVANSSASAAVTATTSGYFGSSAGGLLGSNSALVTGSRATGAVAGVNVVGGLVGFNLETI